MPIKEEIPLRKKRRPKKPLPPRVSSSVWVNCVYNVLEAFEDAAQYDKEKRKLFAYLLTERILPLLKNSEYASAEISLCLSGTDVGQYLSALEGQLQNQLSKVAEIEDTKDPARHRYINGIQDVVGRLCKPYDDDSLMAETIGFFQFQSPIWKVHIQDLIRVAAKLSAAIESDEDNGEDPGIRTSTLLKIAESQALVALIDRYAIGA